MSEVDKVEKSKVEQKHLRGRNMFDVVSQLVSEYNESNGWALKRVIPNLLSFEVYLERSSDQAQEDVVVEDGATDEKEVTKEETSTEEKNVLVEKKTAVKPVAKTSKKASPTSADKLVEATKI